MSNLTAARLALFGKSPPRARSVKPYDHVSKAEMWAKIEELDRRLARVRRRSADFARDSHQRGRLVERDNFHEINRCADLSVPEVPSEGGVK